MQRGLFRYDVTACETKVYNLFFLSLYSCVVFFVFFSLHGYGIIVYGVGFMCFLW